MKSIVLACIWFDSKSILRHNWQWNNSEFNPCADTINDFLRVETRTMVFIMKNSYLNPDYEFYRISGQNLFLTIQKTKQITDFNSFFLDKSIKGLPFFVPNNFYKNRSFCDSMTKFPNEIHKNYLKYTYRHQHIKYTLYFIDNNCI